MSGKSSLSKKYALWSIAVSLAILIFVMLSVSIVLWHSSDTLRNSLQKGTEESLEKTQLATMDELAKLFQHQVSPALYELDVEEVNRLINGLLKRLPIKSIIIADASGNVLTDGTKENSSYGSMLAVDKERLKKTPVFMQKTEAGYRIICLFDIQGYIIGYGEIIFSKDPLKQAIDRQEKTVAGIWQAFTIKFLAIVLIGIAFIILITVFISTRFSKTFAMPLIRLRDAVIKIASGDLTSRVEVFSDDEIGELAGSFNRMVEELQKRTAELRESEEKYRSLASTQDSMFLVDRDCRYLFANEYYLGILGLNRESVFGRKFDEFNGEEASRIFSVAIKYVYDTDNPYQDECVDRRSNKYLLRTFSPVRDKDGNITAVTVASKDITERKKAEKQLQYTLDSLRKAVNTTIQVMVSSVEVRDPYTAGHQTQSANLARAIATEMGLSPEKIEGIRMAGSIHDIGKLSIPAEILSKPTKLSELEFSLIKEHAHKGFEMLKDVESPWPLAEIVHQHHERMDGSGYPRNLKGEEICIEARILTVADVVEAMASHRPYRPGLGIDLALSEIEKNSGIFYDKTVADACLRLFREKGFKLEGT